MKKEVRASLVDYMCNVGKLGCCLYFVTFLSGYLSVIGLFGADIGVPTYVWFLLFIIGALFTPLVAYHKKRMKVNELQGTINKLLGKLPSIEVTSKVYEGNAFLLIKNIGNTAEFTASGQVSNSPLPFKIAWQGSVGVKKTIAYGDVAILNVASRYYEPNEGKGKQRSIISLNTVESGNNLVPTSEPVKINISITSIPRLLKPFTKTYVITLNNDDLSFNKEGLKP